jgi:predicted PurR-regulated permease PerM
MLKNMHKFVGNYCSMAIQQQIHPRRRPFTFDRVVRLTLSTLLVAAVVWLIYVLRSVLLPFGVAVLVAYILEPFVQFNRRLLHLRGRAIAVFVTLFETVFAIGVLCYFFVPTVMRELGHLGSLITVYATSEQAIPMLPEWVHRFLRENVDFAQLSSMLMQIDWLSIAKSALHLVSSGIGLIIDVFNWLMVVLYVVFILLDYDRLTHGFKRMVPPRLRGVVYGVAADVKQSMNHYFRGQALVAFCVGVLFSIGFLIVGLPLAVVLGLFIGLLNMVPYLQLISIPITAILCLIYSIDANVAFWPIFGESIVVYVVVQGIQDLILTPRIMGKAMGMNPAIILLSLSVWGTLLGLLGMIIALPMTTLLQSYYDRYVIGNDNAPTERPAE